MDAPFNCAAESNNRKATGRLQCELSPGKVEAWLPKSKSEKLTEAGSIGTNLFFELPKYKMERGRQTEQATSELLKLQQLR